MALLLCQAKEDTLGCCLEKPCVLTWEDRVRSFTAMVYGIKGGVTDKDQGVCRACIQ